MNDFSQIVHILQNHWKGFVHSIPSIIIGIIVLFIAWVFSRIAAAITRKIIRHKIENSLTQDLIVRMVSILIFLFGVYLIFEMANLAAAALAIISGTGVLGIILGIAFRDITENFLASTLLSINHPFRTGDLVEIANFKGYVQGLTMRVTQLISQEGIHIQIPNSIVYKSHIRNFSTNPNLRDDFTVAIRLDNSISDAQKIVLEALEQHVAILKKPEPSVLVDGLLKNAVNLRIYYWFDGSQRSGIQVKSSVIHLVKRAFQEQGISIALDEISVHLLKSEHPPKESEAQTAFALASCDQI